MPMDRQVKVEILEDGADAERLDTVTRYLRDELARLDVDGVRAAPGGEAPEGSRAFDVVAVGGLLVSITNSQVLRAVVTTVRGWLRRTPVQARTVRLELDGDVLELSGATSHEQERLVELFLSRHAPVPGAATP
jgi:hypothetical protein